ncbi:MAG: NAD(P)H-hydrate dehydratase [Planctomycetota bacterium]|jgi:NAD(P)H-hydrate epimerase
MPGSGSKAEIASRGGRALLSVAEMSRADAAAVAAGVAGSELMANAGRAVAEAVQARWEPRPLLVCCGPGNNGGDGFVAARHLTEAGWPVRLALLGDRAALKGDAAYHAAQWRGEVLPLAEGLLADNGLVVDALFGAGLSRPLEGAARAVVVAARARGLPVVAVDVPSGLSGDSGRPLGDCALQAERTVTFFRKKPGHLLLPGRELCGELVVADIGIPDTVLEEIAPRTWENGPDLWAGGYPRRGAADHKYNFGHAVVLGGATMTGAARLAARAALRIGAGLVTVACPREALAIYALSTPSIITQPLDGEQDFADLMADPRRNAILLGPGNGVSAETRTRVLAALKGGARAVVLDADALTVFQDDPGALFTEIRGPCVLTPHEGEFARLFPDLDGDKLACARRAAERSGAVVLVKGADTVIAAPDGAAVINANAPPDLATAGAGDVLAGLVLGLLAQGMATFDATCASAWLHGEVATILGPGLIAEDLPDALPEALGRLP